MYPSQEQIEKLHKNYSPSDEMYELVFTHCKIVWEIAEQIIAKNHLQVNKELVKASALMHDIGTYKFIQQFNETGTSKYYQHGLEGYQITKAEGLPEDLCLVVKHHMRLGLTKEAVEYEHLDLPLEDYSPTTIEEKIVMYADKFHSKKPQFNSFERYREFIKQFGEEQVQKFDQLSKEFGIPDLTPFVEKYGHPVK